MAGFSCDIGTIRTQTNCTLSNGVTFPKKKKKIKLRLSTSRFCYTDRSILKVKINVVAATEIIPLQRYALERQGPHCVCLLSQEMCKCCKVKEKTIRRNGVERRKLRFVSGFWNSLTGHAHNGS